MAGLWIATLGCDYRYHHNFLDRIGVYKMSPETLKAKADAADAYAAAAVARAAAADAAADAAAYAAAAGADAYADAYAAAYAAARQETK